MTTFFKTQDGRLRGFRLGACLYSLVTLLNMFADGWRSMGWIAWGLLACGFFFISSAEDASESKPATSRTPIGWIGAGLAFLGLILLIFTLAQRFR